MPLSWWPYMTAKSYPIAILSPAQGKSLADTLATAMKDLRRAGIAIETGAVIHFEDQQVATILLSSSEARSEALKMLSNAGIQVAVGAAGFHQSGTVRLLN